MTLFIMKTKILSVTYISINTFKISVSIYNENRYNCGNSNYTIDDILINQWFSNSNKGLAWQIKNITKSILNTSAVLLLEYDGCFKLKNS